MGKKGVTHSVVSLKWRFLLVLLLFHLTTQPTHQQDEFQDIFLSLWKGIDSPSCSSLLQPCYSISYALDLLASSNNTNIRVNLLDDYVPCDWKFKNSNITKLYLTSPNQSRLSCSIGVGAMTVPHVRFYNLKLELSAFLSEKLEIFDCLIAHFSGIYEGILTMDNVIVGNEFKLKALQMTTPSTNSQAVYNLATSMRFNSAVKRTKLTMLIRNSIFMAVSLSMLSYWEANLQFENCSIIYSSIQLTYGQTFVTGNNDVSRPDFSINGTTFTKSSLQFVEVKSVTISNSIFNGNLPNHIGNVFSTSSIRPELPALYLSSISILNVKIDETEFMNCDINGALYLEGAGINANTQYSIFSGNSNRKGGAAITVNDIYKLQVLRTLFQNNNQLFDSNNLKPDEGVGGGSIFQYQSILSVVECAFENSSALIGGAVFSQYAKQFYSYNVLFNNNTAVYGGAYAAIDSSYSANIRMQHSNFVWNRATKYGGAIFTLKSLILLEEQVSAYENYASIVGGGLYTIGSRISYSSNGYSGNYCGNGTLSNYASFPEYFTLKIPEKQMNFTNYMGNTSIPQLEISYGEKFTLNIEMFDQIMGYSVNSFTEFEIEITISNSNHAVEFQKVSSNTLVGVLYSRSEKETITNGNSTLTFNIKTTLFKKESYSSSISIPIRASECKPWFTLRREERIVKGDFAYSCQFNVPLIIPFIFIALCIVSSVSGIIFLFACVKLQGMRKKIKILHKKEQAEVELTQKLLDLQSLYASELESKYSIKNWLIKLEDIKVVKKIGEGGMGVVFFAYWKNVEVALKSIKLDDEDMDTNEFEHESSMLSSMRHPNIVNFYGVVLSDKSKFMVTEYMNGGCLEQLIYECKMKKKHLTLKQKLSILIGISNGMSYLHGGKDNCMIIHRDLKPGNILLSNDLTPKVCDFGLSKLSNESSNTTKTGHVGTLLFMSPEILLGKHYNEKSDVYSFAIIMWQLIFDENLLFQYSYGTNPKYSTIMSKQEIETFAKLANQTSLLMTPKMISEGLRLPLPSLPINSHSPIMKMWIKEYFIMDDLKYSNQNMRGNNNTQVDSVDSYLTALNSVFELISSSWREDFDNRPSFADISEELFEIRNKLDN